MASTEDQPVPEALSKESSLASAGASSLQTSSKDPRVLVEELVQDMQKRSAYMRKVHEGSVYWLNLLCLSTQTIHSYYSDPKFQIHKRAEEWFILGISIAPLLSLPSSTFLSSLSLLWEEWEVHFGYETLAGKGRKLMKKIVKGFSEKAPDPLSIISSAYQVLATPNIPSTLDYCEILYVMCEMTALVYRKFLEESQIDSETFHKISKIDYKFRHHIFHKMVEEINNLALQNVKVIGSKEIIYNRMSMNPPT
eukprot:TRINITY_DN7372_c0_g1_i1.p1 TRINITY_DN7372_c0_g1~~TRINITY_DN7372_c0_g1_i1.p1  ORF type:complete len:265 (-),score=40.63 TRINITY_DN7372_c0_g1_i1:179-934(-)